MQSLTSLIALERKTKLHFLGVKAIVPLLLFLFKGAKLVFNINKVKTDTLSSFFELSYAFEGEALTTLA